MSKYPKIKVLFDESDVDNVWALLGDIRNDMKKNFVPDDEISSFTHEAFEACSHMNVSEFKKVLSKYVTVETI